MGWRLVCTKGGSFQIISLFETFTHSYINWCQRCLTVLSLPWNILTLIAYQCCMQSSANIIDYFGINFVNNVIKLHWNCLARLMCSWSLINGGWILNIGFPQLKIEYLGINCCNYSRSSEHEQNVQTFICQLEIRIFSAK